MPHNSVEVEEMRYQPVLISLKAFFNDEICILSESISMGSWLPSNQLLMAFKRICIFLTGSRVIALWSINFASI